MAELPVEEAKFCLDCNAPRVVANDGAEVTCDVCGGFRMIEEVPDGQLPRDARAGSPD
jgi:hypothetical protein